MISKKMKVLNEELKKEIRELEQLVFQEEGLVNEAFLSGELNYYQDVPCFYLGYEENKLVSFLTIFLPEKTDAEIVAFTHPEERRKGYFKQLLEEAKQELKQTGVIRLVYAVETKGSTGNAVIKDWNNTTLLRSEYRLKREKTKEPFAEDTLTVKVATVAEVEPCIQLAERIFETDDTTFVENAIRSPERELYLAYDGEQLVGSFQLHFEGERTGIYSVGIAPELRHQGYGKKMMLHILKTLFEKSDLAYLDVDSENPSAYNLYFHNGFEIEFQVDYYEEKF